MRMGTGSASLLLRHGRGIGPQDASKKDYPIFLGCGRKPWVPSTCAGDLRELVRVPLRSQGHCGLEGTLGTPVVLVLWKRASS